MWAVGLTVKIKLHFQIPPAWHGRNIEYFRIPWGHKGVLEAMSSRIFLLWLCDNVHEIKIMVHLFFTKILIYLKYSAGALHH